MFAKTQIQSKITVLRIFLVLIAMTLSVGVQASGQVDSYLWVDYDPDNAATTEDFAQSGIVEGLDNGQPPVLVNVNESMDQATLENFYAMVPEAVQVDPAFLLNDFNNFVVLDKEGSEGEIKVTFLNEGAGYRNSLGYFIYDSTNPPANNADLEHVIIMPNTSKKWSGGQLYQGDQVDLKIKLQPCQL
jgi:hypothetical protein